MFIVTDDHVPVKFVCAKLFAGIIPIANRKIPQARRVALFFKNFKASFQKGTTAGLYNTDVEAGCRRENKIFHTGFKGTILDIRINYRYQRI